MTKHYEHTDYDNLKEIIEAMVYGLFSVQICIR